MASVRLVFPLVLALVAAAAQSAAVPTASGPVTGVTTAGVESFKGIPFAKPPVGDLRWMPPAAPTPWTVPFKADHYGHDCMQVPFPSDAAPLGTEPAEDCLVLNVWRSSAKSAKPRPVIVWIYGGGFVNGGSSPAVYDMSAFAQQGLVAVSFNYRLGRFGFFGHPALTAEAKNRHALGNYGYMDQIAALKWVQKNIRAFGGDPAQVTIIGESAGGGSVHVLLAAAQAKGLFNKAIVMSGGGRGPLMGRRELSHDNPGLPSAEAVGVNFAASVGIEGNDAAALKKLRALDATAVRGSLNMANMSGTPGAPQTYAGPMIDGVIAAETPDVLYATGHYNHAAVMMGATAAEFTIDEAMAKAMHWPIPETADAAYSENFPGVPAADAARAFNPAGTTSPLAVANLIRAGRMFIEPARHAARLTAAQGDPTYLYRFSYVADSMAAQWPEGARHATDIPFFFDTVAAKYGKDLTAKDADVAKLTNRYIANFALTGDPNGAGLSRWPATIATGSGVFDFGMNGKAAWGADPAQARLDFIAHAADATH